MIPVKTTDLRRANNGHALQNAFTLPRPGQVAVSLNARDGKNKDWDPPAGCLHQLDEIAPLWHALERCITSPVQQFLWSETCCGTLPLEGKLHFVVEQTGSQTGAIAPLVRSKGPLGRLEHLGVKILREPADLVFSDPVALKNLANTLFKLGSALFLDRVPASSPTIAALQEAYRGRGLVIVRPAQPFPRILLHVGWRNPESQLNSSRRSDLRRAVRNAEKIGPLSYQILSPTPSQLGLILEEALEVEAANWKGSEGSAIAHDRLRGPFYRHFAAAASAAGTLRLCFLRVGGRAVAMQLALEWGGASGF